MEITSPPRLVAIDTEVFEKQNFNYESKVFQNLISLVQEEKIKLLITTVTYQEIKAHITEGAQQASTALNQAIKNIKTNKLCKASDERKIFSRTNTSDRFYKYKQLVEQAAPSFDEINSELLGKFENFLEEVNATILQIDQASSDLVVQSYFSQTPPFRKGRKKNEFPDAFALFSLRAEAESQDRILYAVSGDSDWKSFCEKYDEFLIGVDSLDNLLETIIREYEPEDEIEKCYEFLEDNQQAVEREIASQFSDLEFSVDLSSLVEWGSEEVYLSKIGSITIKDTSLIDIDNIEPDEDPDEIHVVFELQAQIEFTADVSFLSLEFAIYDKEDGKYYGSETINIKTEQTAMLPVEVSLTLNREKDYTLSGDISDVNLDPNGSSSCISVITGWENGY